MGLHITAYRSAYLPSGESREAPHDARAEEVSTIRMSFGSDTTTEMLRLLRWRPTGVDGFGRWVAGEAISDALATLRERQAGEASRPRGHRRNWEPLIRFLGQCENALVDQDEPLILVVG